MARIRSLRPALLDEQAFGSAGVGPRALGYGLIQIADDSGRFRAARDFLKGRIFPYNAEITPADIELWLGGLHRIGWVSLFSVRGQTFGEIAGWTDRHSPTYQRIDKPTPSDLPAPSDGEIVRASAGNAQLFDEGASTFLTGPPAADSTNVRRGLDEDSTTEGSGKERSGVEEETALRAGARGVASQLSELVAQSLGILETCPRFVVNDITTRVQVENAIAAVPDADPITAAHEAVVWASDPAWKKTNPGAVFLDALRHQRRHGHSASSLQNGSGPQGREHPASRAIRELDEMIPGGAAA